MERMNRFFFICVIFSLLFSFNFSLGQTELPESGIGLSASYQDNHLDIQMPIWLSNKISLAPAFGVVYVEGEETAILFGLFPRFYLKKAKVSPYLGFRIGFVYSKPENTDSTFDGLLGICAGGEYFLDKHFSIGIEAQLNASKSDENSLTFGNPGGINLNTATSFFATIYF